MKKIFKEIFEKNPELKFKLPDGQILTGKEILQKGLDVEEFKILH